jgi:hypothetical protein
VSEASFKLVVVESPYAGAVQENLEYLRACMRDCLRRSEAPYASHGLYTQPGVLDDTKPDERRLGMEAGFAWGDKADLTVVYIDRGLSLGMKEGIKKAMLAGRRVVYRSLYLPAEYDHCPEWVK